MNQTHIAIDIETMGKGPTAAIIALGARSMEVEYGIGPGFYQTIGLEGSMRCGGQVDGSTIMWWLKQSDDARAALRGGIALRQALSQFSDYVTGLREGNPNGILVWGNGVAFDNVILRSAYASVDLSPPWTYKEDACLRTLRTLFPSVECPQVGVKHHAGDDAKAQALWLQSLLKCVGGGAPTDIWTADSVGVSDVTIGGELATA